MGDYFFLIILFLFGGGGGVFLEIYIWIIYVKVICKIFLLLFNIYDIICVSI